MVQKGAGEKIGFDDAVYQQVGAKIVEMAEDIYQHAAHVTSNRIAHHAAKNQMVHVKGHIADTYNLFDHLQFYDA